MTCETERQRLTAYLDGELELTGALELERHLDECPACAAALAAQRALSDAIGDADLRYHPTPLQRERLRRALRRGAVELAAESGNAGSGLLGRRLRSLAALLAVAVGAWSLGRFGPGSPSRPEPGGVGDEVVASHVRSLLGGHPEDVISTDRHTVKPWFEGKLDYAPEVVDLAADGFPLAGGRLDYVDGRPVAALVYRSDRHVINLFTWPESDRAAPRLAASAHRGFHVVRWTAGGMTYWAVSDLAAGKLEGFARRLAVRLGTG